MRRWSASKGPFTIDHANAFWSEEVEKTTRKVKGTMSTFRTLVHDDSLRGLSLIRHGDGFETVWTRISVTELRSVQGHDKV